MEKYLKMSDWFDGEIVVVGSETYFKFEGEELSQVAEFHSENDAKYSSHAINSHDELVAMNKELLEVIERVIGSSNEFDKIMGTSEWADGYKQCAIDTGEALRGIIDNIKAKAAS